MERLPIEDVRQAVQAALAEDVQQGDVTTLAVVPENARAKARMVAREPVVVAGLEFACAAFAALTTQLQIERQIQDGQTAAAGVTLLTVAGPARPILTAERVALNFVQRLSGVATLTAKYVEQVQGTRARVLDTRKTTPGWRRWEKYAVACGGELGQDGERDLRWRLAADRQADRAAQVRQPV